tara:strand:- start:270 stop:1190 length:921 start_codon:yes stop_codon:yes gene_type:complete
MSKENSDLINKYLEFVFVQKNLSKNTLISYQNDLQEFSNIFGKIYLANGFDQKIDEYIKYLSEKFSPKSHCRKLSSVRNFLSYLFDLKLIKKNPTNDIEFPKIPKNVPKFLSEIEVDKIIQKSYENKSFKGLRTTLLIEILYATGIRVSELVSIKLGDIKDDYSSLMIKSKGGDFRYVPLFGVVMDILKKYLDDNLRLQSEKSKFLFPSNSKIGHLTRHRFFQILKDLSVKAGLDKNKISPHVIRHSFASHLLNRGVDLRIIQESLGHKDISTTQIYTHIQAKKLRKILENKHNVTVKLKKFEKLS